MKLSSKFTIHPLTLFFILTSFTTGYFKYMFIIFAIVFIHECGHYAIAKIFNRKVKEMVILPFGGLLKIDSDVSSDIFEDLLIAVGGIGFQTVLGLSMAILYRVGFLDENTFSFFRNYNTLVMLFNLIPICPLDGYKILKYLFELVVPYRLSFVLGFIIALFLIIGLSIFETSLLLSNFLVVSFLVYCTIKELSNKKYVMMRFYVERMNKFFSYPIKYIKSHKDMYKNRVHVIDGVREDVYLKNLFTHK